MKPLVNNQELFKAIAEGKEIQYCIGNIQYRIKPKKVKKRQWVFQSTVNVYLVTGGHYKDQEDYNETKPHTPYN